MMLNSGLDGVSMRHLSGWMRHFYGRLQNLPLWFQKQSARDLTALFIAATLHGY